MDIIVSFSEIDTFRQCPFKHELSYKERWREPDTSPALARGTAWHSLMEERYILKKLVDKGEIDPGKGSVEAVVEHLVGAAELRLNLGLADKAKEKGIETPPWRSVIPDGEDELLRWMLAGDIAYWGDDPDWKVLGTEIATVQLLPFQAPRARKRFFLKTKIDLVVRERATKKIRVVDHKSGKDLPKRKKLDLDDQFKLYTWVLQAQNIDVFGQTYNAARTTKLKTKESPLDERFSRTKLYTTPKELELTALDALRTVQRAYGIKEGEADRAPNTDTCGWKCGYTEPCLFGRKGGDTRVMLRDMGYVQDFTRH